MKEINEYEPYNYDRFLSLHTFVKPHILNLNLIQDNVATLLVLRYNNQHLFA